MVNTQKIEDELNDDIQLAENIEIDDNSPRVDFNNKREELDRTKI